MSKIARVLLALMLSVSLFGVAQTASSDNSQTGAPDKQAGATDKQAGATDKQAGATDKKTAKAEKKEAKAAEKGKAISLTGWVKTEGDKVVFVNDKDKQTWTVKNADVVKPLDGKHVKVKATLDESDHSLTVDNVKQLRKGKQSGETQAKQ